MSDGQFTKICQICKAMYSIMEDHQCLGISEPQYITDFLKAVYPEMTDLSVVLSNEETMLTDATSIITSQQKKIEELELEIESSNKAFAKLAATNCFDVARIYDLKALVENVRKRIAYSSDCFKTYDKSEEQLDFHSGWAMMDEALQAITEFEKKIK